VELHRCGLKVGEHTVEIVRNDTDYAMRALVHLALHRDEEPVAAKVLARAEDIPVDFAYKLLRSLTKAGLTESHMGVHGGFALARRPEDITLLEVVEDIQGPVLVRRCLLGKEDACPRYPSCPVSAKLVGLQDTIVEFMSSMTLAEVLEAINPSDGTVTQ